MYFGLVAIAREFSGRIDPRLADKLRDISDETERWLRRPKKRHGLEWLVPIDWGA
jgi:hypothetical protein